MDNKEIEIELFNSMKMSLGKFPAKIIDDDITEALIWSLRDNNIILSLGDTLKIGSEE